MILRTAVLAVYVGVLAGALLLQYFYPWIAVYVFYGFLFWLVASFFVFRLPGMGRPIARSAPPSAPAARPLPGTAPLAGSPLPASGPAVELTFCAFCGSDLPEGAAVCPVCKHEVRTF